MTNLSNFTQAEKEACVPTIHLMVDIANLARAEGVLALEEWANTHEGDFLKFMLLLIVDGTDPRLVWSIGEKLIETDNHTGAAMLSRLLMLEGISSIQAGENPRLIAVKLFAMLGIRFLKNEGLIDGEIHDPAYKKRIAALENQNGIPGSEKFNTAFAAYSNRDMQCVLRETEISNLALALKGSNGKTALKFLSNCSKRVSLMVLDDAALLTHAAPPEILEAQATILKTAEKLQQYGEIMLDPMHIILPD